MMGAGCIVIGLYLGLSRASEEPAAKGKEGTEQRVASEAKAVKAKPISDQTKKGLAYLANQQHANGGWGQGGGWRSGAQGGRTEGADVQDPPDVGNTAIAALAFIRAGNTPKEGPYAANVAKAVEFLAGKIEKSDKESLHVTDVLGTQLQSKIGQYVDTFLAALVLSELKGTMPDEASEKRLTAALNKTMDKIARHQKEDGTFAGNTGWASVLSQALCSKAINRAAQNGAEVQRELLDRDAKLAANGVNVQKGDFAVADASGPVGVGLVGGRASVPAATTAPTDAGVSIYAFSAKAGGLQDRVNTARTEAQEARRVLASKTAPAKEKDEAKVTLQRVKELEETNDAAASGIIKRLDDKQFIAGFGNNGGEEFVSYMNISETLLARGGQEWQTWDKSVCENLHRVQNEDGSWSGHHCITGRTFCTATALLTVMADRAPVPLAAKIKEGK
jgi:hypothetical protein